MKTKLLLASLFLGTFLTSKAQTTTVYSNDFTAATGLTIIDGDGDTKNWGLFTGDATSAGWGFTGNFAGSRSWQTVPLTPNNFLLTPEIVIPDTFGTTSLSFKLGSNDAAFPAEQISVYLATATANTAALITALTPVFNYTLTTDDALTANTFTVDVSAYAGQTVKIVFRHHDTTDQDILLLDDVLLTQTALATDQFAASHFSVFPNPATNVVNVSGKNNTQITGVSISDLNGRVVKQSSATLATVQIDINDLAKGVYMMNITSNEGTGTKKIIKN